MQSKDYTYSLQFPLHSEFVVISIISWPKHLDQINKKIARNEKINDSDIEEIIFLNSLYFSKSVDAKCLQDFQISTDDAQELENLVKSNQKSDHIQELPSLVTILSKNFGNIESLEDYKSHLILMLETADESLSLMEWISSIEKLNGFDIWTENTTVNLKLPPCYLEDDGEILEIFPPDDPLRIPKSTYLDEILDMFPENPFLGLFQWLAISSNEDKLKVLIGCEKIGEAYVQPFIPTQLLAVKCFITSKIVIRDQFQNAEECIEYHNNNLEEEAFENFVQDHTQITLLEAFFRFSPNKHLSKLTIKPTYANIKLNWVQKFTLSSNQNPGNKFVDIKTGQLYEAVPELYDLYLLRPSYLENMCFFNFFQWYEKGHAYPTSRMFEDQPLMAVSNDDKDNNNMKIPNLIELENKETTMKRLKSPRIIALPETSDIEEKVFQQILLFVPHRKRNNYESLPISRLKTIFYEKDCRPEKKENGDDLTKIETVRLRCNSMFYMKDPFENLNIVHML